MMTTDLSMMNSFLPKSMGSLPSVRKAVYSRVSRQVSPTPAPAPPPHIELQMAKSVLASDVEMVEDDSDSISLGSRSPLESSRPPQDALRHSRNGVRWKHATEGCEMVKRARYEASSMDEDEELSRQIYLDGVGYILRGLPEELSSDESAQIAALLPASLVTTGDGSIGRCAHAELHSGLISQSGDKNYVYHITAVATLYGVLLAGVLAPHLERLGKAVYAYDQQYRLSARIAKATTSTMAALATKIYGAVNDGKAGQVVLGMTVYALEGASQGLLDGYTLAVSRAEAYREPRDAGRIGDNFKPGRLGESY